MSVILERAATTLTMEEARRLSERGTGAWPGGRAPIARS